MRRKAVDLSGRQLGRTFARFQENRQPQAIGLALLNDIGLDGIAIRLFVNGGVCKRERRQALALQPLGEKPVVVPASLFLNRRLELWPVRRLSFGMIREENAAYSAGSPVG